MRQWFTWNRIGCPAAAAPQMGPEPKFDQTLRRLATATLLAPILITPWMSGDWRPLGQLILSISTLLGGAALALVAWRRPGRTIWTFTPAHVVLLAAVALVGAQLTPLPTGALRWLSPSLAETLPLWFGAESAAAPDWERWSTISVAPAATRSGLTMLLVYVALFAAALELIRSVECVERLLRGVCAAVVLVALGSLLLRVFGDRNLVGAEQPLTRAGGEGFLGPFREPSHLTHFLALGIGPLVCLTFAAIRAHREARRGAGAKAARDVVVTGWRLWWRALAVVIVCAAALLVGSIAGAALVALATLFATGILYRSRLLGSRTLAIVAGVAATLVLASVGRHWGSIVRTADLGPTLAAQPHVHVEPAGCSFSIDWRTFCDFWPLGAGVNTFDDVAPRYCGEGVCAFRGHAVNDYVQIALDTGILGLTLTLAAIGWVGWRCYRLLTACGASQRAQLCLAAVAAGLTASLTQAAFECVWHVPAAMATTTLLAACATRLVDLTLPSLKRAWRFESGKGYLAVAAAAIVSVGCWGAWHRARVALAAPHWAAFELAAVADLDTRAQLPDRLVAEQLREVLRHTPDDAHAHLQLAEALHAKMSESLDETLRGRCIRWGLEHSRAAVRLSPLAGEGYVYLAAFQRWRGELAATAPALIRQALLTRPYHCEVLMAAGAERAEAHDLPQAVAYWRNVFRAGADAQSRLAPLLVAHRVPVQVILDEFQPDLDATRLLDAKYTPSLSDGASRALLEYYLHAAEAAATTVSPESAASLWVEIEGLYERLGQPVEALRSLRRAAAGRPSNLELRAALGQRLLRQHEYAEAEMHFKWCLQRRPEDARLRSLLEETQQMLQADGNTAGLPRRLSR